MSSHLEGRTNEAVKLPVGKRLSLVDVVNVEEALLGNILSYGTANEESSQCVTCQFFRRKVEDRRSLPCVVSQARETTAEAAFPHANPFLGWQPTLLVLRMEPFEFVVFTGSEDPMVRHLTVNIGLRNFQWEELANRRLNQITWDDVAGEADNFNESTLRLVVDQDERKYKTMLQIQIRTTEGKTIFQLITSGSNHPSQSMVYCGLCHFEECQMCSGFESRRTHRNRNASYPYLDLSLSSISPALKAIAAYDTSPTFQFMMKEIASINCFREYFLDFEWNEEYADRQTPTIRPYRPAKTKEEWEIIREGRNQHFLHELPWYQDGYWEGDIESYEYYWDSFPWYEESTSSLVWACWRRVQGSEERGELCIAQMGRMSRESIASIRRQSEQDGRDPPPLLPVPSSEALFIDELPDVEMDQGDY